MWTPDRLRHRFAVVVLLAAVPLVASAEEKPWVLWSYSQFATFEAPGEAETGDAALQEVHSSGRWVRAPDQAPGLTAEECRALVRPSVDALAQRLRQQDPGLTVAPQTDGLDTVASREKRTVVGLYRNRCFPADVTPTGAPTEARAESLKPSRPAAATPASAATRVASAAPGEASGDRQQALGEQFRRDLERLLGRLERAMGYLGSGLTFEEFEVRVAGFERQVDTFKRQYGVFMDRDDDARWLAHPVLKACDALLRAERVWGRQVAEREHLAFLHSELKTAKAVRTDFPGVDRARVRQHTLNIAVSRAQLREVEEDKPAEFQAARELFKRATEAMRTGTEETARKSDQ